MSVLDDFCKRLYLQYAGFLIKYARCYVDGFSAEDVVHDAFMKFYGKKMLEYSEDELRKLLYVAVRNLCIDYLRHESCISDYRARTKAEMSLQELEDTPSDELEEDEMMLNRISGIVEQLPDKRKEIFKLYYYKGMDSKSIAVMLGLSQRTVENNVYRALVLIRKIYQIPSRSEYKQPYERFKCKIRKSMELSEEKIESLIMGFFEDRLSEEELRDFREWMESDSAHSAYVRSLKSINDKRECGDLNVDDIWRRLALKIDDRKRMKRRFTVRLAVGIAAGLLLLLSVGISLFSLDSTDIVGERQRKQFAYSTQRSVAYVELPDGTSVHLAPNTEFRYFDDYGDDERRVFLDGEGYFEVQKESRCPFVVVSGDQEIIVTGTKFNVRSYSEDNESVTTLLEGSITFRSDRMRKTINLQPKEQVRYNDESQTISVKYVPDAANAILWMDSRYVFENDSLADILDRMQNLYEVKFVCTNEKALNSTYKVTFYQDESLDDFLRVVGKMSDLSAVEKGDTVYLK